MSLSDFKFAAELRDLVKAIADKEIDKKRPDVRIGYVYKFNVAEQAAYVMFRGESSDNLVRVHAATNMLPTRTYEEEGDLADIVRVAGKPGAYYITDYVRGVPQSPDNVPLTDVNFNDQRGVNLADPEDPQDAATKAYVDAAMAGAGQYREFQFVTAEWTWTMTHNLNRRPVNVVTMNFNNEEYLGDVTFPDLNTAVVSFGVPFAGKATIS